MKKIIMVSMSLLCCALALAQEEFESLLSESKVWTMTTKPSLSPEEFGDLCYIEETKLVGDTIINGIHFMRKYNRRCKQGDEMPANWSATNEYLGQEGSRIYQYSSRSKKMIPDMDFALEVGDKVSYYFDDEVVLFDFVVTAVSDTIIGNSTDKARRRCMYAQVEYCPSVTDVWIEGIGSMQYGISGVWKTMATGSFDQMIKCTDGNKCIFTANATVDEYTDPKTNVVYTYDPGNGTASVKAGYDEVIDDGYGSEEESIYHSGCPDATGDMVILDRFTVGTEEYVVTGIGEGAFYENKNIKSVNIPETVTDIGLEAFAYCESLTEVHLPESLTQIAPNIFCDCIRLVSINIPSSVNTIGLFAFAGCSSLTSITLPERLTFVGRSAFYGCSGLTSVISLIEEPFEIDDNLFDVFTSAILYVPKGCKARYEATSGWNNFQNIVERETTDIQFTRDIKQERMKGSIFNINGRRLSAMPQKGVYIQNGKKLMAK